MEPLFTIEQCQEWTKLSKKMNCCNNPHLEYILKQDRAMDEMPSLYKKCKNCHRIIKSVS